MVRMECDVHVWGDLSMSAVARSRDGLLVGQRVRRGPAEDEVVGVVGHRYAAATPDGDVSRAHHYLRIIRRVHQSHLHRRIAPLIYSHTCIAYDLFHLTRRVVDR